MATVSDNFNRTDENLDGSTASGGGTWVEFENTAWRVVSNRAWTERLGSFADHSARLDVALDGDDHEVEATLAEDNAPGASFFNTGLIARKEDNSTKTFYAFVAALVVGDYVLVKFVAGSFTSLDTGIATPTVTDVMRLKCDGSAIAGYVDEVEDVSDTDSSIAGAGYIQVGLTQDHGNESGDASLDDFSGTDLAVGDPVPSVSDDITVGEDATALVTGPDLTVDVAADNADYQGTGVRIRTP